MKTSPTISINDLVVEYHRLYAKYQRPEYREIAANLGRVEPDTFEEEWKRRVNEGCDRNGIPRIY